MNAIDQLYTMHWHVTQMQLASLLQRYNDECVALLIAANFDETSEEEWNDEQ